MQLTRGQFTKGLGLFLTLGLATACSDPLEGNVSKNNAEGTSPIIPTPTMQSQMCAQLESSNLDILHKLILDAAVVPPEVQKIYLEELARPVNLTKPEIVAIDSKVYMRYEFESSNLSFQYLRHAVRFYSADNLAQMTKLIYLAPNLPDRLDIEIVCEENEFPTVEFMDGYYTVSSFAVFSHKIDNGFTVADSVVSSISGCGPTVIPVVECNSAALNKSDL
jgi:hypothetical protein